MDKFRVVPLGPGHSLSPSTPGLSATELAAFGITKPFVLRIGGYTQRKNIPLLIAAWKCVRRQVAASLVLAGPPLGVRDSLLASVSGHDAIVVLDYVSSDLLPKLLRSAAALVSPSILEGFGMPPLEAMTAGVPVVAVRSSSSEEVCGTSALFAENTVEALAEALVRVLSDAALRPLVMAGLDRSGTMTWDVAASSLVSVYREFACPAELSSPQPIYPKRGKYSSPMMPFLTGRSRCWRAYVATSPNIFVVWLPFGGDDLRLRRHLKAYGIHAFPHTEILTSWESTGTQFYPNNPWGQGCFAS